MSRTACKTACIVALFMLSVVFCALAEPSGNNALKPYTDTSVMGNSEAVITTMPVSTTTTLSTLAASRSARRYLDIVNVTSQSMLVGVVNSTQSAGLFTLSSGAAISDKFPGLTGYTGAVYGRSTVSTDSVKVLEVY